jgi:hypothetical protein
MFCIWSNSFIGDWRNHIRVVVTITTSLVVWINWSLNSIEPLAMTVFVPHRGTGFVLHIPWDNANLTKKELRVWVDRMKLNKYMFTLNIIYSIYTTSSWYYCHLTKDLILYYWLWFINFLLNKWVHHMITRSSRVFSFTKSWTYTSIYFPPINIMFYSDWSYRIWIWRTETGRWLWTTILDWSSRS